MTQAVALANTEFGKRDLTQAIRRATTIPDPTQLPLVSAPLDTALPAF
jgi:hypothetical protein